MTWDGNPSNHYASGAARKPRRPRAPRPPVPLEHVEQRNLIRWADTHPEGHPGRMLLAIPNGGHRNKATAGKLRAEGVRAGVPDLFLPVPAGQWYGLWIELKRQNASPSDTTPAQREWHRRLEAAGYYVAVCRGWVEGAASIKSYLDCARVRCNEVQ